MVSKVQQYRAQAHHRDLPRTPNGTLVADHLDLRHRPNGDWFLQLKRPTPTRDAVGHEPTIGEVHKKAFARGAVHDDPMLQILDIIKNIGHRLDLLEIKRRAAQQAPTPRAPMPQPPVKMQQPQPPVKMQQPQPTRAAQPTKDHNMPRQHRHPGLAPLGYLTFNGTPQRSTRDQWQPPRFGETPSRFTSQEVDRMASYLPPGSAGLPSREEMNRHKSTMQRGVGGVTADDLNNINRAAWSGAGKSGQTKDPDEELRKEQMRRAQTGEAPLLMNSKDYAIWRGQQLAKSDDKK